MTTPDDDMTIDAGGELMDEIRRLAAEARADFASAPADDELTIDASGDVLDDVCAAVAEAK